MTYKSIGDTLAQLVAGEQLKRFLPEMDPDQGDYRDLFMTKALYDWCYQTDRKRSVDYKANIRNFLGRYVLGGEVDNLNYMKSWTDHVFEFRVQLSRRAESTRIFGAFMQSNCFVATHWKLRREFGAKSDPAWTAATDRALSDVRALFPGHEPRYSKPFRSCVTDNAIDNFNLGY